MKEIIQEKFILQLDCDIVVFKQSTVLKIGFLYLLFLSYMV